MRIIGGKYRGKKLPLSKTTAIRPSTDRFKETLFNILEHKYKAQLQGNVLDLFAGSGALGLECLSRGAEQVVFVDILPSAIQGIKRSLKGLTELPQCHFICADSQSVNLTTLQLKFSLILLDPPYDSLLILKTLQSLLKQQVTTDDCLLIIESNQDILLPQLPKLSQLCSKKIGKSWLKIYQLKENFL